MDKLKGMLKISERDKKLLLIVLAAALISSCLHISLDIRICLHQADDFVVLRKSTLESYSARFERKE